MTLSRYHIFMVPVGQKKLTKNVINLTLNTTVRTNGTIQKCNFFDFDFPFFFYVKMLIYKCEPSKDQLSFQFKKKKKRKLMHSHKHTFIFNLFLPKNSKKKFRNICDLMRENTIFFLLTFFYIYSKEIAK